MGDAHRPVWAASLAPLSTVQQTGTSSVPNVGEEEEEKEEQEMLSIQRSGCDWAPGRPPALVFIVPDQGFQMVPEHSIQIQVNKKYWLNLLHKRPEQKDQ